MAYLPRDTQKRPPRLVRRDNSNKPLGSLFGIPVQNVSIEYEVVWPDLPECVKAAIVPFTVGEYYKRTRAKLPYNLELLLGIDTSPAAVVKNSNGKIVGTKRLILYSGHLPDASVQQQIGHYIASLPVINKYIKK